MRKIHIQFGNEEASKIWVADVKDRGLSAVKKIGKLLNTIPGEGRFAAFAALNDLLVVLGEVMVTQAKATEDIKNQIPNLMEALVSFDAREKAIKRIAKDKDGKQVAKTEAFKLWKERYAGKHPKLRRNEDFAMECLRRWDALTSLKVILGWCTTWNKEARASKPQPAS